MKKKIILILLVLTTIFIITGCDTNTNKKTESKKSVTVDGIKYNFDDSDSFHDLKYKFEKDTKNIKVNKEENHRGYVFYQDGTEDELFRITFSYKKDKDIFNEFDSFITKDSPTVTYNNTKWYHYYDDAKKYNNTILNFYVHQNGNDAYSISFAEEKDKNIKLDDYIKTFMTNVSFK